MSEGTEDVRGSVAAWQSFEEGWCWQQYKTSMEAYIGSLMKALRVPIASLNDIAMMENLKGQITAIEAMLQIPALERERLQSDLAKLIQREEENERSTDSAGGSTGSPESGIGTGPEPIDPSNNAYGT